MEIDKLFAKFVPGLIGGYFGPEEVLRGVGAGFLDEEVCRRWVLKKIHTAQAISCPACTAALMEKGLRRFWGAERVCCPACGKFFTAMTGTFLQGCHLNFGQIVLLAMLLQLGIRHQIIAEKVGVSVETVRLWQKKYEALRKIPGESTDLSQGIRE